MRKVKKRMDMAFDVLIDSKLFSEIQYTRPLLDLVMSTAQMELINLIVFLDWVSFILRGNHLNLDGEE